MDPIERRIREMTGRVEEIRDADLYFYLQPIEALNGAWATVNGREMLMFASYSYLDLLGHPKIDAAAQAAIARFGTGTHGVRILAGTLPLHQELEATIASFEGKEAAIVYSSGYVTNLATISALVGRHDVVICDKWNHASIVDGCLLSGAKFVRFRHNDMADLEARLAGIPAHVGKLMVVDAVFSMDGDIVNLPEVVRLCRQYGVRLMVDEAHSLGVLGATGRGIEEHFGLEGASDIKITITYLKHTARGFIFSAALPPAAVAAAKAAFEVIQAEPERIARLRRNVELFIGGLRDRGFDTGDSETPVVPIICGEDEPTLLMSRLLHDEGIFVLPVLPPAVPMGTSRLRANVTAAHSETDIAHALDCFQRAGEAVGVI